MPDCRAITFGHAGEVANALNYLKLNGGGSILSRLFHRQLLASRVFELEYRTCAATTRAEARATASRLLGLPQTAWRWRLVVGWAGR